MGIAEIIGDKLFLYSHIITYGNAANAALTEMIREEIESMWNEPAAIISLHKNELAVVFSISAAYRPDLADIEVLENIDARNNYFRIEEFAHGNISFVDGIGSNTGYFKLENLYKGSTTAAHEYGHTLGLSHPDDLNLIGKGGPGIMYPRGTYVNPDLQYDPQAPAGTTGGFMHPMHRKVQAQDIENLRLHHLNFIDGKAIVGEFTSIWHPNHADITINDLL